MLSKALCARGLVVCTPIDSSSSKHFDDITDPKLLNWVFQMISEDRFKSVIVEPVCTTFSPAQHPASRSYAQPVGFNRRDPNTPLWNIIAFRCLAILWFAWRWNIVALLEQPQLSKMAWLSFWRCLLQLGFEEAIINSCAFGSIHRKPFRWLGFGIAMQELNTPCPGSHHHVRIEGKYTRASSIYHPELAKFLALKIHEALICKGAFEEKREIRLESAVLNDVLTQDGWEVLGGWEWKQTGHINVLESSAYVALLKHLVLAGGDVRFSAALDSRVARGAHAKGRSSADALCPSLCRACALTIAGNLHQSFGFAPTRLNTADAPTRDRPSDPPSSFSILDFLSNSQVAALHSCQFSRAVAGWVRLFILVTVCPCPGEGCNITGLGFSNTAASWICPRIIFCTLLFGFALWLHQFWTPVIGKFQNMKRQRNQLQWLFNRHYYSDQKQPSFSYRSH